MKPIEMEELYCTYPFQCKYTYYNNVNRPGSQIKYLYLG